MYLEAKPKLIMTLTGTRKEASEVRALLQPIVRHLVQSSSEGKGVQVVSS